jgi:hypothetical protein
MLCAGIDFEDTIPDNAYYSAETPWVSCLYPISPMELA